MKFLVATCKLVVDTDSAERRLYTYLSLGKVVIIYDVHNKGCAPCARNSKLNISALTFRSLHLPS